MLIMCPYIIYIILHQNLASLKESTRYFKPIIPNVTFISNIYEQSIIYF